VDAEAVEASLNAGDTLSFRRWSRPMWTILSRIGASTVLLDRISCLRLFMVDDPNTDRGVVLAGDAAAEDRPGVGDGTQEAAEREGEASGDVGS
jgi:hypothetical protein